MFCYPFICIFNYVLISARQLFEDGLFSVSPSVSLTSASPFDLGLPRPLLSPPSESGEASQAKSGKDEKNAIKGSVIMASVGDPEELTVLYH